MADLIVTILQFIWAAITGGLTSAMVVAIEVYLWGLLPPPFSLLGNLLDPLSALVEVVIFVYLAYRVLSGQNNPDVSGWF